MKNRKYILAVTALALLFVGYGCFGEKKEKKVDTPVEAPRVDDKDIAFEVFERIPKEDLYEGFLTTWTLGCIWKTEATIGSPWIASR